MRVPQPSEGMPFTLSKSYGAAQNPLQQTTKLIRVADLMLPDEPIDRMRFHSRRGSRVSNLSSANRSRAGSNASTASMRTNLTGNTNFSVHNYGSPIFEHSEFAFGVDIGADSSVLHKHFRENRRINPMDPAVYDKLDFCKALAKRSRSDMHTGTDTPTAAARRTRPTSFDESNPNSAAARKPSALDKDQHNDYLPRDSDAEDELGDNQLLRGMPAATRPASPSN